jgi:hypothetical protein
MTAPDERPNTIALRRIGRFLFDWAKSLGLFVVVVATGTFLFLVSSTIVGFLPYSDRPGPGWGRGAFSWHEVGFFVGWLPLLIYPLLFLGLSLFPFVRLLGWFRAPRWLLRVFGTVFSGLSAFVAVMAAGWYIAISQYPVYAGALSGIVYGAILLPRASGAPPSGLTNWKHWAGMAATVIACGAIVVHPLLPKEKEQSLEVLYVRLIPGPEDLTTEAKPGGLTPDELKLLKSLGLAGTIRFGMGQIHGNTPTEARAVIVFTGELHSRAELREPLRTRVLYVQQGDGWTMYPPNARTIRNEIKFWPSSEDVTKIEAQSDPAVGSPTVFSWCPALKNSK